MFPPLMTAAIVSRSMGEDQRDATVVWVEEEVVDSVGLGHERRNEGKGHVHGVGAYILARRENMGGWRQRPVWHCTRRIEEYDTGVDVVLPGRSSCHSTLSWWRAPPGTDDGTVPLGNVRVPNTGFDSGLPLPGLNIPGIKFWGTKVTPKKVLGRMP